MMTKARWLRILFSVASVIFLSNFEARATRGGGVKNGGSGLSCGHRPFVMADYLVGMRSSNLVQIEDREVFFNLVLDRIPNETFRKILTHRWNIYGNSDNWPMGHLDDLKVYYYDSQNSPILYLKSGLIPAADPSNPICQVPMYSPSECCSRILISFFDERSSTPIRIVEAYSNLSRYQKNILELHEAVYRSAWDLGLLPTEAQTRRSVSEAIEQYRAQNGPEMLMPSNIVVALVSNLIDFSNSSVVNTQGVLHDFWAWSKVTQHE